MSGIKGQIKTNSGKKDMIKSMTGFGKGVERSPFGKMVVEIKTLNHKNLSIACNAIDGFFLLEEKLQKTVEETLFRGKVFINLTRENNEKFTASLKEIEINEGVAREYLKKIKKAQKKLEVKGDLNIRDLLLLPGVVENHEKSKEEELWPYIKKALEKALDKLIAYRKKEGLRMAKDFDARIKIIAKNIEHIEKYERQTVSAFREKLIRTVRDISGKIEVDNGRIETEVAMFAKNCDIAEELTRIKGHLVSYKETMAGAKADIGKKLDFIAQEMQREANTISAKSCDFSIAKAIIDVKSEIEKIREQIKNVE